MARECDNGYQCPRGEKCENGICKCGARSTCRGDPLGNMCVGDKCFCYIELECGPNQTCKSGICG